MSLLDTGISLSNPRPSLRAQGSDRRDFHNMEHVKMRKPGGSSGQKITVDVKDDDNEVQILSPRSVAQVIVDKIERGEMEPQEWWGEREWEVYINKKRIEMEKEHREYCSRWKPIYLFHEMEGVMTRAQRAHCGRILEGRCFGVDDWSLNESRKDRKRFMKEWSERIPKNDWKYPGPLTEITEGAFKGWKSYKGLTINELPEALNFEGSGEVVEKKNKFYKENRQRWFEEGWFNIILERNTFAIDVYIHSKARALVEEAFLDYEDSLLSGIATDKASHAVCCLGEGQVMIK